VPPLSPTSMIFAISSMSPLRSRLIPSGAGIASNAERSRPRGGEGWADVWKRECFGWEYKGKRKDLNAAFVQLQQYAIALENPPLLVVCDLHRFRIHTNWTNSVSQVHEFTLDDLRDARVRQTLKWVWSDPEKLKPGKTRAALTEEAAAEFARLAQRLRNRNYPPEQVAHFINRIVFCMFAEDVGLLPGQMFKRMLEQARRHPGEFEALGGDLFKAMRAGGRVGFEHVDWFNGGLFDDDAVIPLDRDDIALALHVADLDWSEIDTSIFGTLFERGLDPDKRSQLGAHYTDRDKVILIVEPVIIQPWLAEWARIKEEIEATLERARELRVPAARTRARNAAEALYRAFLDRLRGFRVLDPACGSGNFLYLALLALKDLEHRVGIEAEAMGLQREFPSIGPDAVKGIEINRYAAELARVTVWIGEIQWMRRNGFDVGRNPILKPLDTIECRDAILNPDGTETEWPAASVVIGNPPFLGAKLMKSQLGLNETMRLRSAFRGRLPGFTDLVCYWFEKTRAMIEQGVTRRAGLVATNSIRKNTNLPVMRRIAASTRIFAAWPEQQWTVDGAAVDVSLVCFGDSIGARRR
jgi:type II restriction/modification system DNA methylase subunit YeeA